MDSQNSDKHFLTIFIFPFRYFWQNGKEKQPPFPSDVAKEMLLKAPDCWEERQFEILDDVEYNEWHYFYPYVRAMLFETLGDESGSDGIRYLCRRDYNQAKKAELEVEFALAGGKSRSVKSEISSVDLHVFDNQIGLLSITTEGKGYEYEDYLRYNDAARRVYPPFLKNGSTNDAKMKAILPKHVGILINGREQKREDFRDPNRSDMNLYLSNIVREFLMPIEFRGRETTQSAIVYDSFTDDRMFLVSYYRNESLARRLSQTRREKFEFEESDEWYSMIFVDNEIRSGIANEQMKRELINSHTYGRWAQWGTLYGLSRYSLIALCRDNDFARDVLAHQVKSMYYQMAIIVLFQRAMLVKFSQDVKDATRFFPQSGELNQELRKRMDKLHGEFIKFTNQYWITEPTPQEQGLEMYRQWVELLRLDYLYEKVKSEISEMAVFVRSKIEHETYMVEHEMSVIEHRSNEKIERLTEVGIPLSVIIAVWTLWIAFFGDGGFTNFFNFHDPALVLKSILIGVSIYALSYLRKPVHDLLRELSITRKNRLGKRDSQ